MPIKAAIFDQDETLIQPDTGVYEQYVIARAQDYAQAFGISSLEEAKKLAYRDKLEKCNNSTIELYDLMGLDRSVWYDRVNGVDVSPFLQEDDKLKKFLNDLKNREVRLFLLTNSPTKQTHKILNTVGINHETFDHIFTWERNQEPPKPGIEPFTFILEKFNLQPEECLMVGNEIQVDLETAHSLGIKTVGINLDTPADEKVDFEIKEIEEILEIIESLNKG